MDMERERQPTTAGTTEGGGNDLTQTDEKQREFREVVGRRGYDEADDETEREDEQH